MTTTATPPPTIHTFTAAAGWGQAPCPMPEGDPKERYAAGWLTAFDWSDEGSGSLTLELLCHDEHGYVCYVWLGGTGTPVHLPQLPDMLAFLEKTLPLVKAAAGLDDREDRQIREANKKRAEYAAKARR